LPITWTKERKLDALIGGSDTQQLLEEYLRLKKRNRGIISTKYGDIKADIRGK
jgi:hypothetical protein